MASAVKPEEVYLSVLVHFFVHPPPPELLRLPDKNSATRKLAVFLLRELKEPDSPVYPTLPQLCSKLRSRLGDLGVSLVSCLEVTLKNLRCTHDVFKLFEILETLLVRNSDVRGQPQGGGVVAGLDPLSPLGLFIRKVRVAHLTMSFEAMAQLFTAISADVRAGFTPGGCFRPTAAAPPGAAASGSVPLGAQTSSGGGRGGVGEAAAGGAGASGRALRDRSALEVFVSGLIQRIEQQGPSMPQAELDAALEALEASPSGAGSGSGAGGGFDERQPLARLVRLQSALQHRDYTAALDLLHSYYNCIGSGGSMRSRNASGLLGLSSLHAALGHTAEALPALSEAMRLAQQSSDSVALLTALGLLCRLLATTAPGAPGLPPHGPAALRSSQAHHVQLLRMLRRCGERGFELNQPQLEAFAQLAAARFMLLHDVEPSDSGLHAPPGSLTAAATPPPPPPPPHQQQQQPKGAGANAGQEGAAALGELRSGPLMVQLAVLGTLGLATDACLSAAAPAAPPPPPPLDGSMPAQQRTPAVTDLYPSPFLFDRTIPAGAAAAIADSVQQLAGAAHLLQAASWGLHGHDTLERIHTMTYLAAYSDPRVGCGAPARFEDRSTACAQLLAAAARRGPAAAQAALTACLALLAATESPEAAAAAAGGTSPSAGDAAAAAGTGDASTASAAAAAGTAASNAAAQRPGGPTAGEGDFFDRDGGDTELALWGGPALAAAWLCAAHDRALSVGDLEAAGHLVAQLAAVADPQPHRDVEYRLEAARRGVLNLVAAGASSRAHEAATDLFARCADVGLQAPALRCLLLLAEIHLAAGDPNGALPHVLACLLPAQPGPLHAAAGGAGGRGTKAGEASDAAAYASAGGSGGGLGRGRSHDLLAAEALVVLCRVWYELSDGQQLKEVLVLLQDALPLILAHGSAHLQARAQFTVAEMVMAEAESSADLDHCYGQLQRLLTGAIQAATAAEDFRQAAAAACLLAWLHQGQGATAERDLAAELHEALMERQAEAEVEAACAAEGRVVGLGRGPGSGLGLLAGREAMLGQGRTAGGSVGGAGNRAVAMQAGA